jgi:hypothetical protein
MVSGFERLNVSRFKSDTFQEYLLDRSLYLAFERRHPQDPIINVSHLLFEHEVHAARHTVYKRGTPIQSTGSYEQGDHAEQDCNYTSERGRSLVHSATRRVRDGGGSGSRSSDRAGPGEGDASDRGGEGGSCS